MPVIKYGLLFFLIIMAFPFVSQVVAVEYKTLGVLLLAIILWTFPIVPSSISSIFIIASIVSLELVDQFSDAVTGFVTMSVYFVLTISLLSFVMMNVGIGNVVTTFIIKMSKHNKVRASIAFFAVTIFFPLILPSAVSRLKVTLPIINDLNQKLGLGENSGFKKLNYLTASMISQFSQIMFLSGGPMSIIAFQLILDNDGVDLSWLGWLSYLFIPISLSCLSIWMFMVFFFKPFHDKQILPLKTRSHTHEYSDSHSNMSKEDKIKFQIALWVFVVMVAFWIFGPWLNIPLIVPPMVALMIFALPGLKLIESKDINQNADWNFFLFFATALSLGKVVHGNGTGEWIAGIILSYVHIEQMNVMVYFFIVAVIVLLRLNLTSPAASVAFIGIVLLPTVDIALPITQFMMIILLIVAGFMVFPVYSPSVNIVYHTGVIKLKEHVLVTIVFMMIVITMAFLFFYLPYI